MIINFWTFPSCTFTQKCRLFESPESNSYIMQVYAGYYHLLNYIIIPNLATFPFSKITVETLDGKTINMEGSLLRSALQYLPTQVS